MLKLAKHPVSQTDKPGFIPVLVILLLPQNCLIGIHNWGIRDEQVVLPMSWLKPAMMKPGFVFPWKAVAKLS